MINMKNIKIFLVFSLTLFCLISATTCFADTARVGEIDQKRNRLIGYILSKQLPALHYSDKVFNDELARAAFHLYIKQLDYQKRYLLKKDVEQLEAFAPYIDNNLADGRITLPDAGYDILTERINLVQKMVGIMLQVTRWERDLLPGLLPIQFYQEILCPRLPHDSMASRWGN